MNYQTEWFPFQYIPWGNSAKGCFKGLKCVFFSKMSVFLPLISVNSVFLSVEYTHIWYQIKALLILYLTVCVLYLDIAWEKSAKRKFDFLSPKYFSSYELSFNIN